MRLTLRISTPLGPRTIVTQHVNETDARLIADVIVKGGGEAFVSTDGPLLTIKQIVRNPRRRAEQVRRAKLADNVKPFPARKARP